MLEKMSNSAKNKCFICGKLGHFANECGTCDSLEDMDKCLVALETFIKEKRELENVNVPFEIPTLANGGIPMHHRQLGNIIGSRKGSNETDLLIKEYNRTKEQKQKNNEYLPMFEVIQKSIQLLNEKVEAQKKPNESIVADLFTQLSRQKGITLNEEMIAKAFNSLF
jgi:hypothetical protein